MTTRIRLLAALALSASVAACQSVDVSMAKPRYATRTENLPTDSSWEEAADHPDRGSVRVVPAKPRYASRPEDLPAGETAVEGRAPQARSAESAASPASARTPAPSSDADPRIVREAIVTDELPPVADASTPERGLSDPPRRAEERPAASPRPATRPESTNPDAVSNEDIGPAPAPVHASVFQYVIQPGDTIAGIGRRFGVHAQTLIELNGLEPRGAITAGKPLNLPASARDGGSDPYATGPTPMGMGGRTNAPADTAAATDMESGPRPPRIAPTPAVSPAVTGTGSVTARGRGRFIWPVRGEVLARFGVLGTGLRNDGINIGAPDGTPVKAAADGEVVYAGSVIAAFGNMVLIKHADGWVTAYGYLSRIDVHMRDTVKQGQVIGAVGSTGGMPQPQLHFEIRFAPNPREKAAAVDPLPILR